MLVDSMFYLIKFADLCSHSNYNNATVCFVPPRYLFILYSRYQSHSTGGLGGFKPLQMFKPNKNLKNYFTNAFPCVISFALNVVLKVQSCNLKKH